MTTTSRHCRGSLTRTVTFLVTATKTVNVVAAGAYLSTVLCHDLQAWQWLTLSRLVSLIARRHGGVDESFLGSVLAKVRSIRGISSVRVQRDLRALDVKLLASLESMASTAKELANVRTRASVTQWTVRVTVRPDGPGKRAQPHAQLLNLVLDARPPAYATVTALLPTASLAAIQTRPTKWPSYSKQSRVH